MSLPLTQAFKAATKDRSYDLFNCVQSAIFVLQVDESKRPVYAAFNDYACEVAGLTTDRVIGQTAIEIYGGRLGAMAYARHLQAIWSAQPLSYELTLPLQNQERTVRTTLEPVLDEAGEVAFLFGTSADISDEQKLREANFEVETVTREMKAVFDQTAHDLRTPMRQISEVVDVLRIDFLDHKDGKLNLINTLGEIALNAQTLITDMLSQAHAGRYDENETIVDFQDLCTKILVTLDPMELHEAYIAPITVEVDQTALQIALRNLIDHLFQGLDEEKKLISLTAEETSRGILQFTVRDYGFGFGEAAHQILLEQPEHGQNKFGLHGVRRLIKARGGAISIHEPEDGPGAIVKFTLPGKVIQPANENS